jgi:hypothetical protein
MKSSVFTMFTALAIAALLSAASAREVTIEMRDNPADGWDGNAALRVSVNGSNLSPNPRIASGGRTVYRFDPGIGDEVNFYWIKGTNQNKISYVNWSVSDKNEAASALKPGSSVNGNWTDSDLTLSGRYII